MQTFSVFDSGAHKYACVPLETLGRLSAEGALSPRSRRGWICVYVHPEDVAAFVAKCDSAPAFREVPDDSGYWRRIEKLPAYRG